MNREIKFRAWDAANGIMEYNFPFFIHQSTGECYYFENHSSNTGGFYDCGEEEPTLMQFTGLTDKNGKDIYEGDVVTMKSYNYQHLDNLKWEVVYVPEVMQFQMFAREYRKHGNLYESIVGFHSIEVLGNIYEHSHLLNTDQNDNQKTINQ